MIELKHLRLLRSAVAHGTISGAARELGYSQPALTQQIQALERYLGTPVLVRSRRGIVPTDAGRILLRHAELVLQSIALAESEIEAVAGLRSGRIRIACFPSAAGALMPQMFARMKKDHPGLHFEMIEADSAKAVELVRRGECDLAIIYSHLTEGETFDAVELGEDEVLTPLFDERVDVVLPTSHPLVSKRWVDVRELRDDLWIAGCPRCRGNLEHLCRVAGFEPQIGFETDDYLALHRLAALGLGVALAPELMHTAFPNDERLALRPLQPLSVRQVGAVSTGPLMQLPAVQRAVEILLEQTQDAGLRVSPSTIQT
ncbi:LysR family transcriptional regulator [Aeromicrobium sp. YIM 150415]|uniref:LysR family transcriptional regulator n=1 Tax=Aeromicrobium sp. YIM 150415 TaxID=2803912 RepID=UPI0019624D86|nr:LysR family transcriptional regulator [Aeromicrobium sp. YIM 150415]MBM9463719.1 LysR family transcriptional regulator [Aeromicrobium sp. YIM 150415]